MWADTLLALERAHLLRLLAWGAASVLAGTLVLALLAVRGRSSALLRAFSAVTAAWGAVVLLLALGAWSTLAPRDFGGAVRFERLLWLNVGLDAGYVGIGVALAACGWTLGRRLALLGAGVAVVVQGLALLLLDLVLASRLVGLVR